MNDTSNKTQAIELLQELGLKEYEAKAFVALARREQGTAKDISETSEVPRTRVYDAIRVLESKGLVETQQSNPQLFRAVSIEEAVNTLQTEYIDRIESLRTALSKLERTDNNSVSEATHEVWTISGSRGIASRTQQLLDGATEEAILVVGQGEVFSEELADHLREAQKRGVTVFIGTIDDELRADIQSMLPDVEVFLSGLEWVSPSLYPNDTTEISRLLLVDREAMLVSSFTTSDDGRKHEKGVFGQGFNNGLVAVVRRLLATGLELDEPAQEAED